MTTPVVERAAPSPQAAPGEKPAWRAKIGWIKPGPVTRSIDRFFAVLPPDVDVVIGTTNWSLQLTNRERFDAGAIERPIEAAIAAVRDLQGYDEIDFVAVTGDLVQAAMGPAWNAELRGALEGATHLPAATAMTAAVEALRRVGARRLAIASPVSAAKNQAVRAYLEAEGFTVERLDSLDLASSRAIHALPAEAPYTAALAVAREAPGADALYLPSLSWGAERYAERLEQELGLPVITLYNSLVWAALTAIRYPTPVDGYGRILRAVGGGSATDSQTTMP
jgi:maleate cis-trans isomerase